MKYYPIKWNAKKTIARRKTAEVDIICTIFDDGKSFLVSGTADCEHHLIEDAAILLKKMAEVKCGH
jgi:cell division protein ZapA (FtsZ GTPase activity inhibitor)